jgi:hypothetical protein|tara:strand:- start:38 stop:601 length:564 start_codon:yes stop_codon:yes gene_type:complete
MKPYLKWTAISVGSIVVIAHIGVLGHLLRRQVQVPTINIPHGTPYSSYKIEAGKDGYTIEYKANDPAILESQKSLILDKDKKGLFGSGPERRREWRRDQFTMEGVRNIGGATTEEGKSVKDIECIVADAGARSQGAMAGSAVATGVLVPAVVNIPYIGWLAAGWAALLGNNIGSEAGSMVNSAISDC